MSSPGKGLFLVAMAALGLVLVFAVCQVPQPWRGALVGWLLFMATFGYFVLRLAGHYVQLRSIRQSDRSPSPLRTSRPQRRARSGASGLRVVTHSSGASGRRTIS